MKTENEAEIIDITEKAEYEKYLYKCLAPMPFRKYNRRHEYLSRVVPRGFRKKLLIFNGDIVGTIEYAPAEVSGFPIAGNKITVMNCIWVLRRAKGHSFGKQLIKDMMESEKNSVGFATIALENHWSGWMRKDQMERLGFKAIDSIRLAHKTKHIGQAFTAYLMWLPTAKGARPPGWNKSKLLEGINFCMGYPLYHPESLNQKQVFKKL
jgi:ribosomal protein S18 acetylase RimI-like enzyme